MRCKAASKKTHLVLGLHFDPTAQVAIGHAVRDRHGLGQGTRDRTDDAKRQKNGQGKGHGTGDQDISPQAVGRSFRFLAGQFRGLGLEIQQFTDRALVFELGRAQPVFQQCLCFLPPVLFQQGEELVARPDEHRAPLLQLLQQGLALLGANELVHGVDLRHDFAAGFLDDCTCGFLDFFSSEQREIAKLDGLLICPVRDVVQHPDDGNTPLGDFAKCRALSRRAMKRDTAKHHQKQHHDHE